MGLLYHGKAGGNHWRISQEGIQGNYELEVLTPSLYLVNLVFIPQRVSEFMCKAGLDNLWEMIDGDFNNMQSVADELETLLFSVHPRDTK